VKRRVLIDLETTALSPERGEILRLYTRDLNDPSSTFDQLVKPKRPISKLVQQTTGISNALECDLTFLKNAVARQRPQI
jgi:DNA polymerase III epsilon subunit-like protein